MEFLYHALTVSGGLSGLAAFIVCWLVLNQLKLSTELRRRELEENRAIARRLEVLETERFKQLEDRLSEHLREDNPAKVEENLKKIAGDLLRLSDSVSRNQESVQQALQNIVSKIGRFDGTLDGINIWLRNVNQTVETHVTNGGIHGNGKR